MKPARIAISIYLSFRLSKKLSQSKNEPKQILASRKSYVDSEKR